jgi:hypothetical protein
MLKYLIGTVAMVARADRRLKCDFELNNQAISMGA